MIDAFSSRSNKIKTLILMVICGLSAIVAAYSIAQGEALGDYLFYLFVGKNYEAGIGVIFVCGGVALIGGFLWLFAQFENASIASFVFLNLLVVILAYYLGMVIRSAIKNVQWHKRIARTDTNPFGDHSPTLHKRTRLSSRSKVVCS